MTAEHGRNAGQDATESIIDDLIRDIMREARQSAKAPAISSLDPMTTLLIETAIASLSDARSSRLERVLLAQQVAAVMAEALAPALAQALAPEIVKVLEQHISGGSARQEPAGAGRPAETAGRPEGSAG
jgi:hypothetical protein